MEKYQIKFYLIAFAIGSVISITISEVTVLENSIEPAISILLYSMFCQLPFFKLLKSFNQSRFIPALMVLNFILIPPLSWVLIGFLPENLPLRLGAYLVLLTPCVDYVIFFTKIGQGDPELMLASTPLLLIVQIALLPFFLWLFMGHEAVSIISAKPFLLSFFWLIVLPIILALFSELYSKKSNRGKIFLNATAWLPVPMMAMVLFLVTASESGRIYNNILLIVPLIPVYISFMFLVGILAWLVSQLFGLRLKEARTLWFSGGTRNSLVVLPLALALPTQEWATITTATIVTGLRATVKCCVRDVIH